LVSGAVERAVIWVLFVLFVAIVMAGPVATFYEH
jgi:hypothetical protein